MIRTRCVQALLLEQRPSDGVLMLTLNRPLQRNALSFGLLQALHEKLLILRNDPCKEIRAVVIKGNGPVFCSGHDLKEMRLPDVNVNELFTLCSNVMELVETIPQPVITAVNGIATAAGCQLVAASDLSVVGNSSKFSTPGVNIGLFCSTPAVPLVRCIGRKAAFDMLVTGRFVPASEAKLLGLVSHVTDDLDVDDTALRLATSIASRSGSALAIGKQTFKNQISMNLKDAYACASTAMVENMGKYDAKEGIDAFLQKRNPEWRNQ